MRANRKATQEENPASLIGSRHTRKKGHRPFRLALLVLVVVIVSGVGLVLVTGGFHLNMNHVEDQRTIPLASAISSIKTGLPFAEERARAWRKDAVLCRVDAVFHGLDAVKSRKGDIYYEYSSVSHGYWINVDAGCEVTLDMSQQAMVSFRTFDHQDRRVPEQLNVADLPLDISDIFVLLDSKVPAVVFSQYQSPMIIMHFGKKWTEVIVCNLPGSTEANSTTIVINNEKKTVVAIRNNVPAAMNQSGRQP